MRVSKNQVTLLSAAVAALFAASAAQAQVTLASTNPVVAAASGLTFASEINNGVTLGVGTQVNTILGIGTSANQLRYIRLALTNATFTNAPAIADLTGVNFGGNCVAAAAITPTVSAGGGAGSSSVIYQITSGVAGTNIGDCVRFTFPGGFNVAGTSSNATLTYEVYEFLSDAQNAPRNRLYVQTGTLAGFTPAIRLFNTGATNPTQVATALSGYLNFNNGVAGSAATAANIAAIANINTDLVAANVPNLPNGTTVANINQIAAVATGNSLLLSGDFTAAAAATAIGGTGSAGAALSLNTAKTTLTAANFPVNSTARNITYTVDGATAVVAGSYTAQLTTAPLNANFRSVTLGPITTGSITRDGVQYESPWMTATTGFASRIFVTQVTTANVSYTAVVRNANGLVTGGTLTGTLAGGRLTRIDLSSLLPADTTAFPGPYQVTLTVAADASQVSGTYVLTAPNGAVTSVPLYRAANR